MWGGGGTVSHLGEDGQADVVVTGLVDESGQLVRRDGSRDGLLSRLRWKSHGQVLLVRQQVRASLDNVGEMDLEAFLHF